MSDFPEIKLFNHPAAVSSTPVADSICREHYTAPPKPSTCGRCPLIKPCHSGGRIHDWVERVESAAKALRGGA